ncbi:MAG: ABC transporter ATP-binding protein [Halobacteriota archaeon]
MSAGEPPALALRGVTRRFDGADGSVTALEGVDLTVERGEFLAIVGPSGCGKSTLLRIAAGLTRPTNGRVTVAGDRVTGPGPDRGLVFQEATPFPWRTVAGNVRFGLEHGDWPADRVEDRVAAMLEMVGLADRAAARPRELSGGMKKRVGIARALAPDPSILLLDEPFGNLDALTRDTLQRDLLSIWERTGKTIVFVTHATGEAVKLADRVVVFDDDPGRVRATVEVDLPRPRRPDDHGFQAIKRRIVDLVRGEGPAGDLRQLDRTPTDGHQTDRSTTDDRQTDQKPDPYDTP